MGKAKSRKKKKLEGKPVAYKAKEPVSKKGALSQKSSQGNFFERAVKFLKEVKIEAKKITWPDKKQVFASTMMVLAFSLFIGGYLGLLDVIYNAIISFLVR